MTLAVDTWPWTLGPERLALRPWPWALALYLKGPALCFGSLGPSHFLFCGVYFPLLARPHLHCLTNIVKHRQRNWTVVWTWVTGISHTAAPWPTPQHTLESIGVAHTSRIGQAVTESAANEDIRTCSTCVSGIVYEHYVAGECSKLTGSV